MKKIIVFGMLCMGLCFIGFSQDTKTNNHTLTVTIPEVALLDLETSANKNFTLAFTGPIGGEAGKRIQNPFSNSDIWINYTSIVTASGPDQTRDVNVTSSVINPAGTAFSATAASDAGAGAGAVGNALGNVSIDNTIQQIIMNVGSCYTGNGPAKGHRLTYNTNVVNANYGLLRAGNTVMVITYTLTDN